MRLERGRLWAGTAALVGAATIVLGAPPVLAQDPAPTSPPEPHVPGPVDAGYEGPAYVVPTVPDPANPNVIEAQVAAGTGESGVVQLSAGRPYPVSVGTGDRSGEATVELDDGREAVADASQFWAMPTFIGLRYVEVPTDDGPQPLGRSGIRYHRVAPGAYDDPDTPEYDGTPSLARTVMACGGEEWSIGAQTYTVDLIEQGVHTGDRARLDRGIVGLRWGANLAFNESGAFEFTRTCDGVEEVVPDRGGAHHSTQYLESMSRATYLMASSPDAGELRPTIDETIGNIERVARILTASPGAWDGWLRAVEDENGDDWTHRTFMMAAALGMASTLTADAADAERWAAMAEFIVARGIANQWDEDDPVVGPFPERGGYDLLYQMYGTWLAQLYLSTLPAEAPIRSQLLDAIGRSIEWEISRIDPETGVIDFSGSTRICVEFSRQTGRQAVRLDPAETIRALLLWGYTQGDRDAIDTAVLVDEGHREIGHPCPGAEQPSEGSDAAAPPATPGDDDSGTRVFETPIGNLSSKRVAAAAVAGLLALLVVRRIRLGSWPPAARRAVRIAAPLAVFVAGLVVLAA